MAKLPFGDALEDVLDTYRANAKDMLLLGFLATVVPFVASLLLLWGLWGATALELGLASGSGATPLGGVATVFQSLDPQAGADLPVPLYDLFAGTIAVSVLATFAALVFQGALVARGRGDPGLGEDVGASLRTGLDRFPALFVGEIALGVLLMVLLVVPLMSLTVAFVGLSDGGAGAAGVAGGSAEALAAVAILAVVVGIALLVFLFVALFLWQPAVVVEDTGAVAALRRSFELTRGHRLVVFLLVVVTVLVAAVVGAIVALPFLPFLLLGAAEGNVLVVVTLRWVPGILSGTVTAPLLPLLAVAIYDRLAGPQGPAADGAPSTDYVPLVDGEA